VGRKSKRLVRRVQLDTLPFRAYLRRMEKLIETPSKRTKAVGYVRVSSKKAAEDGGSLDDQRDAIIRHAVTSGLDLVGVFEDGGISGGKDEEKRPGLAAALDEIRSGSASTLVVKHADRLSRDADLAGHLRVIVKRAGGTLLVLDEARDDPYRKLLDSMLAEMERLRGRERMRFTYAQKAARGEHVGAVPYGYRLDGTALVPEPVEQEIVRRIVKAQRAGKSPRKIADKLNDDAVPTRRGKPWSHQHIRLILAREGGSK
jgi:site-specific DNA recombinase